MADLGDVTALWNDVARPLRYGNDDTTYRLAMSWLDDECDTVEDWGCGTGYARIFLRHATYKGIDGSQNSDADVVADLRTYWSAPDGILLRHVLEHNPDWGQVLTQAMGSFRRRMVVVVYTPFSETTRYMSPWPGSPFPEISFAKSDLVDYFGNTLVREQSLPTETMHGTEHVFFLAHLESVHTASGEPESEAVAVA